MKLDCVITATNDNPLYCDFIPIFIRMWKKLAPEADVKIIYISDVIPEKFLPYKEHLILFNPINNINSAFISQYVRILYPSLLNYEGGVLITDMDILPMQSKYYIDNIKNIPDNYFVYLRDFFTQIEIAICYNVASPSTWREINKITTMDDLTNRLKETYNSINYTGEHGGQGWITDQVDLRKMVWEWKDLRDRFVFLRDSESGFRRLDRGTFQFTHELAYIIKNGFFSDYHALRPYSEHKDVNDAIADIICS